MLMRVPSRWAFLSPVFFCALLLFSLPSLAKKEQPAWVTQPPQQAGMAYGVASMEIYGNPQAAVARATELARVDLVSQLRVTVTGDFSSLQTMKLGTGQESEVRSSISNYVRSQVPTVELNEVKVSDTFIDGRIAYVLVELDRNKEAARLQQQISDIELKLLDIAGKPMAGTRLQQLQPLLPALKLLAEREQLAERLALVSVSRQSFPALDDIKALQERIYSLIDQLVVTVRYEDEGARELKDSLLEALTAQGLRVQDSSSPDLTFKLRATLTTKVQGSSHYVFADTSVTVVDGNERVLSSFNKQAKGVSGIALKARQTAAHNAAKEIADELAVTLVDKIR